MDDKGESKETGIRQIVKLKENFHKWQSVTLGSPKEVNNLQSEGGNHGGGGISPAINWWLMSSNVYCDSDEDGLFDEFKIF